MSIDHLGGLARMWWGIEASRRKLDHRGYLVMRQMEPNP
jgi:hypothetical protein